VSPSRRFALERLGEAGDEFPTDGDNRSAPRSSLAIWRKIRFFDPESCSPNPYHAAVRRLRDCGALVDYLAGEGTVPRNYLDFYNGFTRQFRAADHRLRLLRSHNWNEFWADAKTNAMG